MLLPTTRDRSNEKRLGKEKKTQEKKGVAGAKHIIVLGFLLTPWHVPALMMFPYDSTGCIRNKGT